MTQETFRDVAISIREIVEFYDSLLFGGRDVVGPCSSRVAQMYIDMCKQRLKNMHVDSDVVVRMGGLMQLNNSLARDTEALLAYLDEGNSDFRVTTRLADRETRTLPAFETQLVRHFAHRLAQTSKGGLDYGVSSNRQVYANLHSAYHDDQSRPPIPIFRLFFRSPRNNDDEQTLQRMLWSSSEEVFEFHDANYWGRIAKQLIDKSGDCCSVIAYDGRRHLDIPNSNVEKLVWMYENKCKSQGSVVDPFTLELTFETSSFVDWYSVKSLTTFVRAEPNDRVSICVKKLCSKMLEAILRADFDSFPFEIVFPRETVHKLRKMFRNVCALDTVLPQVRSHHIPSKLVDAFQRLLALTDFDHVWRETGEMADEGERDEEEEDDLYFRLYMKNISLHNELRCATNKITEMMKQGCQVLKKE